MSALPMFTILRRDPNRDCWEVVDREVCAADAGLAFRQSILLPYRSVRPGEYMIVTEEARLGVELNLRDLNAPREPDEKAAA